MPSRSVAEPAPRRTTRANAFLVALASAVFGLVGTWWITVVQRVPVHADADLAAVRFGFPLPWVTQDHSSNPFAAYPNDVVLRLTGRTGISYPTEYDWVPFVGDVVIWGAGFWVVAAVALPAVVRMARPTGGARSPRSRL
ncbi:hypothetical protein AB0E56_02090 [Microbacterium sp. NPDC028030]|uniref:hypothetical protein n=1 Tax=Microbacterium sp. NPDC028030 TaxID=3155124 RepID=UPI0033EDF472